MIKFKIMKTLLLAILMIGAIQSISIAQTNQIETSINRNAPIFKVGESVGIFVGPFTCSGIIKRVISTKIGNYYLISFEVMYVTNPIEGLEYFRPTFNWAVFREDKINLIKMRICLNKRLILYC